MKEQYNTYKNPFCLTEATQHLVYLPFGELRSNREYYNVKYINYYEQHWVDMKYNTSQFDTPYKFNGKEKDDELRSNREYQNNNKLYEQTGLNNYGARYYWDKGSFWLSVDPMSDKYPHLTSYNYCANNPVMLVDPDGREIWIALETPCPFLKQFVQYKNGKLYERNGGEYRGNNSFAMKTKNDLITLSESNKLKKRISTLENSERKHTIENTYNKNGGNYNEANAKDLKNNKPTDSKTYYNPDKQTTNRGDKRDPKNGLAHELLSHGYDADQGTYDNKKTENGISMSEVNAVNVENVSRKLTGDKKRTTYGGKTIPPKLLKD